MLELLAKTKTDGIFYHTLKAQNNYNGRTERCIEYTVKQLLNRKTDQDHPGMLLGKIQSGKTRTFLGTIGLAFDNGYEQAIILTKGTKALAYQTYERVKSEFRPFMQNEALQVFDIMSMPNNLTRYELDQKLILVVKKQVDNLRRLDKYLHDTYPESLNRKTLIIDDEADYASIGFRKTKKELVEINTIAAQIDSLRKALPASDFLQVTATPYSLYLQPENGIRLSGCTFKPVKPAFTALVPPGEGYIGGDYYFQESQDATSVAYYLHHAIGESELQIMKKPDRRRFKIEQAFTSKAIENLRNAVLRFLVGGIVRRLQNEQLGLPKQKYSFIIHTEQAQAAHEWQQEIVLALAAQLKQAYIERNALLQPAIKAAYADIRQSMLILGLDMPALVDVYAAVGEVLEYEHLLISKVNSQTDINEMLDERGELKLRVPLNIFIGGQILDRGITVRNLIGFYYGRNPKNFQQDTVLQHARMYGYRSKEDLAATRFYTTSTIYQAMRNIHAFDEALGMAIKKQDRSVAFIQKDLRNQIIPCNPNKILLSRLTALSPFKRMLPVGMQTFAKSKIKPAMDKLDRRVDQLLNGEQAVCCKLADALALIESIQALFDPEKGEPWDHHAFAASMEYLSHQADKHAGYVWLLVRKNRNMSRLRSTGKYEDAPDTPKGDRGELKLARKLAEDIPALLLLRQNGKEAQGWRDAPFWWPVLIAPKNAQPVIYANEQKDN